MKSLEAPSTVAPTAAPTIPTTLATQPTLLPPQTTLPVPTETTLPPLNLTVTPINTYVRGENADGTLADVIPLETDTTHPDFATIQPGQVVLSDSIIEGLRKFHGTNVFYVAICFAPSIDWDLEEYPYDDAYYALRQEVMDRFEKAGYYVVNGGAYCEENCMFYVYISGEQLWRLNCGDDLAIYVFVPRFAF